MGANCFLHKAERLAMVSRSSAKSIRPDLSCGNCLCHSLSMESQHRTESTVDVTDSPLVDNDLMVIGEYAPAWSQSRFWAGTQVPLTQATGLQPAAYTSADFFADEQSNVFERAWVCIGLAADAQAGRVLVREVGTKSILVNRDEDGELHGHLNTCRHRGTELYECDADVSTTLRCPYPVGLQPRWLLEVDTSLRRSATR